MKSPWFTLGSLHYDHHPEVREWLDEVQVAISEAFDCSEILERTMSLLEYQFDHRGLRYRKMRINRQNAPFGEDFHFRHQKRDLTVLKYTNITKVEFDLAEQEHDQDQISPTPDGDIIRGRTNAMEVRIAELEYIQSSQAETIRCQQSTNERVAANRDAEIARLTLRAKNAEFEKDQFGDRIGELSREQSVLIARAEQAEFLFNTRDQAITEASRDCAAAKKDNQSLTNTIRVMQEQRMRELSIAGPPPMVVQQDSYLRKEIQRIHDASAELFVGQPIRREWFLGQLQNLLDVPVVTIGIDLGKTVPEDTYNAAVAAGNSLENSLGIALDEQARLRGANKKLRQTASANVWGKRAEALRRILKTSRGGRIITWASVDTYAGKMDT